MVLLIKNGTVINPGDKTMTKADVLIKDGTVAEVAPAIKEKADEVYDAKGCYVMPGFIDLHVHLRDPGLEYKEDIQTGGAAAVPRRIYDDRCHAEYKTGGRPSGRDRLCEA